MAGMQGVDDCKGREERNEADDVGEKEEQTEEEDGE
jgi:hypothetical protein